MPSQEIHEIAKAWIKHAHDLIKHAHDLTVDEDADGFAWAWEKAFDLKYENPALLWQLILEIHAQDQSNEVAEVLSAGPLEDLLSEHGQEFIEPIEKQA